MRTWLEAIVDHTQHSAELVTFYSMSVIRLIEE
jgi:hypothetical protein